MVSKHNYSQEESFKKQYYDCYLLMCPDHKSHGFEISSIDMLSCFKCDKTMVSKRVRVKIIKRYD